VSIVAVDNTYCSPDAATPNPIQSKRKMQLKFCNYAWKRSEARRGEARANGYLSVTCFCCIVLLCLLDFVCIHSACMLGVLISNNIRRQTACNSGHVCCFWFQRVYSGLHIIHMQRHTCSPILRGPVVFTRLSNARRTLIVSRGLQIYVFLTATCGTAVGGRHSP
jgi:hypothetical protein